MRTIELPLPPDDGDGTRRVGYVLVDWFPPLTTEQHLANAVAAESTGLTPYPNPNLIEIVLHR